MRGAKKKKVELDVSRLELELKQLAKRVRRLELLLEASLPPRDVPVSSLTAEALRAWKVVVYPHPRPGVEERALAIGAVVVRGSKGVAVVDRSMWESFRTAVEADTTPPALLNYRDQPFYRLLRFLASEGLAYYDGRWHLIEDEVEKRLGVEKQL